MIVSGEGGGGESYVDRNGLVSQDESAAKKVTDLSALLENCRQPCVMILMKMTDEDHLDLSEHSPRAFPPESSRQLTPRALTGVEQNIILGALDSVKCSRETDKR